jgi:hypothetical protein
MYTYIVAVRDGGARRFAEQRRLLKRFAKQRRLYKYHRYDIVSKRHQTLMNDQLSICW